MTVQALLGSALMANRPAPNTVIQFVGAGAASLGSTLQVIAGDMVTAQSARALAALKAKTSRAVVPKLQGHRWTLLRAEEGSIKYTGRAIQKLAQVSITTLPIVVGEGSSLSPVMLPDTRSVVYIQVESEMCLTVSTTNTAAAWYRWLIDGLALSTTQQTHTSAKIIRSLAGHVVDGFIAEQRWCPTGANQSSRSARSTIASIVPAIEKLAASRALHSLPLTQQLLVELFEHRKFQVTRPANRLTVEGFTTVANNV